MTYVAARHEMLRTSFIIVDGQPMQTITSHAPIALTFVDLTDAPDAELHALQLIKKEAASVIGLTEWPLLRFRLVRFSVTEHWLIRVGHHILFDRLSWNLYFQELAVLYEARLQGKDPPLPNYAALQYLDYATWQHQHFRGTETLRRIEWWKNLFSQNLPSLKLPFRRAEPLEADNPDDGVIRWGIEPHISQQLAHWGREQGTTYYTVLLAAYVALLSAESGEADVILGAFASTRDRPELQKIFGVFVNLVPIILRCETQKSFYDWLSAVRHRMLEIRVNSLPYVQLERAMQAQNVRMPEMQATINPRPHHVAYRFAGLEIDWLPVSSPGRMPPGFALSVSSISEDCNLLFDASIYDPAGARSFVDRLRRLLNIISRHPHLTIGRLLEISK
jgi:hypothetical protein